MSAMTDHKEPSEDELWRKCLRMVDGCLDDGMTLTEEEANEFHEKTKDYEDPLYETLDKLYWSGEDANSSMKEIMPILIEILEKEIKVRNEILAKRNKV